jgi:Cu+-exporting ATPase
VAIEAADMVLIRSNLNDLVVALDLANKVFSRVKWNMIWAFIYNIVMVPFAAG